MEKVRVEKIIVVGAPEAWKGKTEVLVGEEKDGKSAAGSRKVGLEWHGKEEGKAAWAVVRNPGVGVGGGWKVEF